MATATATTASTILTVEKQEMVRQLHARPALADRFMTHMLTRNIRIEERSHRSALQLERKAAGTHAAASRALR